MWVAWAGGVAFVGSLFYLVYFYAVVLASTAGNPAQRLEHILVNVALFSAFALHHSIFARPEAKRQVARVVPAAFERTAYVIVAAVLTVVMCACWQPIAGGVYQVSGWGRAPFWLAQLGGMVLVVTAARAISAFDLAGIHQARGRPGGSDITLVGPFRAVRHPIYLGWVLMVFGTPTMTANRLVFAVISTCYLILAIPWEERSLVADHGDRYREYQRQVRWRLLPRIW